MATLVHEQHQLLWTAAGSVRATAGGRSWVLPPSRALFVPGGVPHDVVLRVPAALHRLSVQPDACPLDWAVPTPVSVAPLVRELLRSLAAGSPVAAHARAVVLHELAAARTADDGLPLPTDQRAARVAAQLLERPADDTALAGWARRLRVGESTLRRAFVTETGLPFTEWRSRLRLQAALPLLDRGLPVATVARQVGYRSVNGFTTAFRRLHGSTPGSWRVSGGT